MIRLLLRLIGIEDFEVCQSCETLKQQLAFERAEKKELIETLLSILKPKVVESPPTELNPIHQTAGLFSRKRAMLEERDRQEAATLQQSKNLGKPDIAPKQELERQTNPKTVEELEKELDVETGV